MTEQILQTPIKRVDFARALKGATITDKNGKEWKFLDGPLGLFIPSEGLIFRWLLPPDEKFPDEFHFSENSGISQIKNRNRVVRALNSDGVRIN